MSEKISKQTVSTQNSEINLSLCQSCLRLNRKTKHCKKGRQTDTDIGCDLYLPQCLGCKNYNFKQGLCTALQKIVNVQSPPKEACNYFTKAVNKVADRFHIEEGSYSNLVGFVFISIPFMAISYFIFHLAATVLLGIVFFLTLFAIYYAVLSVSENINRGLKAPRYRWRIIIGTILISLSIVIQILFVHQIINLPYLSWIILFSGLFIAFLKGFNIDIREVEPNIFIEEINTVTPASREEIKGLNQKPFAISISIMKKAMIRTNISITFLMANNTKQSRMVNLKYICPGLEPQSDSIPLTIKGRSATKVQLVVHLRSIGYYVVNARISDSQGIITGVNRSIDIISPRKVNFGNGVRAVAALFAIFFVVFQIVFTVALE